MLCRKVNERKSKNMNNNIRRRAGIGTALMALGGIFILCALFLFLYNMAEDRRAAEAAFGIAETLAERIGERTEAEKTEKTENVEEPETIFIDGEVYIGLLGIPALDLALPVMNDWNYSKLKISPCRYSGDVSDDNIVIAAHNYRRHFGSIHRLTRGAELTFTDAGGNTISYAVARIETLEATDVEGMTAGDYDLTLFTCTYGGVARVAVRCDRSM
jgi:sortase A